jgi:hypothetical protein
MELLDFLSLECPFLIPAARKDPSKTAILKAFDDAVALRKNEASRLLYPGVTAGDAADWTRTALRELLEGFYRRQEIKSTLTADERLEIYRAMVLSRTLDELMKSMFQEKKISWEGHPSPQKGFRGFGQEAIAGIAVRLRRGTEQGDIICPLIRDLAATLMYTDDPVPVVLSQVGKKGRRSTAGISTWVTWGRACFLPRRRSSSGPRRSSAWRTRRSSARRTASSSRSSARAAARSASGTRRSTSRRSGG